MNGEMLMKMGNLSKLRSAMDSDGIFLIFIILIPIIGVAVSLYDIGEDGNRDGY